MKYRLSRYLSALVLLLSTSCRTEAQDKSHANSPAFRDYNPPGADELIRPSDVEYQLWEDFMLVRKANAGDPAAQHELGLRYLLGKGFSADTARAAYWIKKAADQNMPVAEYNYSVFLNNGWGVSWDPFEAFRRCEAAAKSDMPEAEFALGLFYADNLVVARNWQEAYRWVKAAADAKFDPARKVLPEIARRVNSSDTLQSVSSSHDSSSAGAVQAFEPVYLDFGQDSTAHVDDLTLLNEAFREGSGQLRKALGASEIFEKGGSDTTALSLIVRAANAGSPEALTVLGRCFEEGVGVPRDRILAAEQYMRASRMDSRRAPVLLWNLFREKGFPEEVSSRSLKGDDDAAFVWAGLTELGLDRRLLDDQAFHLLVVGGEHNNIPSLIELGRCYYTGQWTARNPQLGASAWRRAVLDGSRDAEIRLAAAAVLEDSSKASLTDTIQTLFAGSDEGSLIGQLALAYCFEKGIGIGQDIGRAVRLYRDCTQRGSQAAYDALKRIYDSMRPTDKVYDVE